MPIKTVIFDLGDVLLPVNKEKTYAAFNSLGVDKAKELFEGEAFQALYIQFEHDLDTIVFRTRLRQMFNILPIITAQQIDAAWTAMLEDIPDERLNYIRRLKEQGYKVLLLSNSNEIHHANIQHRYGMVFKQLFDTQYYSHLLKMAKPSVDVFEHVITDQRQEAQEFLFLDDKAANINGARNSGIWAVQFTIHQPSTNIDQILTSFNSRMHPKDQHQISLSVFKKEALVVSKEDDSAILSCQSPLP